MSDRLRILYVTPHWPMAPAYGAQERVLNLAKLMGQFGSVSFVIVASGTEDEETTRRSYEEFKVHRVIRPLPVKAGSFLNQCQHRLRHELDPSYLATDPYAASKGDRAAMRTLIRQHDVVWVYNVKTANTCRIVRWPRTVLDVDDIPSRFYYLASQNADDSFRRLCDLRMSHIWRRRERLLKQRFDGLIVCSEDDRSYLGEDSDAHVIPNGFNPMPVCRRILPDSPRIGFIGTLEWGPNEDGLRWFASQVWPLIRNRFPTVQLRLVGRGSDVHAPTLGSGIVGLLEIAEAYAEAVQDGRRPRRSVLFAAWDAEERGLLGAWYHTERPYAPLEDIAAVLNMDMIGRNEEVPEDGGGRFRGLEVQTGDSNANAVRISECKPQARAL